MRRRDPGLSGFQEYRPPSITLHQRQSRTLPPPSSTRREAQQRAGDRSVLKISIPRSWEEASKIVIVGITFYELTSIRNLETAELPESAHLEAASGRST